MPANVGDRPEQYTFAMSYNRYGWSAYSILALILFVPPREERDRKDGAWIDIAVAGGLLAAMFYLKITYFAVGPGHAGLCRAVPSACRPVLAGVARGRRPAGPQCAGAAQSAVPGRHPGLGDKRRRAQGGDPALQQLRRGDRPVRTVSRRRRGGPVDVVVGTGDVPPAADAPLPAGHVAAAAVAELAGRGHAVGHRRAVRALRPAAHRLLFPRQSRHRAVAADAAAVSAVRRRRLRHQHRGLPCQRPRRTRRCTSSSAPIFAGSPCRRASAARS